MVSSSPSQSASSASLGRERALEVLMDRDPLGSYYRAARAVEEVVPNAFASRPNLVTKAALVEQAFSISKFDIDRLSKYDSTFSETSTERPPDNIMVDTLTRERILNHHHKLMEAQSKEPASITSTPAKADKDEQDELSVPPASAALVAILRQIFDEKNTENDSSTSFDLRQLLEAVASHSVLGNAKTDYKQHLECILATLCRTHASEDRPHYMQGLLLAILSLLTPQKEENPTVIEPPNPKVPQDVQTARTRTDNKKDQQQSDEPRPPALLQVASLLHLFPMETRKEDEPYESFMLDSKLMKYFGTAAAVAEERLELKRARMLHKEQEQKQTEVVVTTTTTTTPKASPRASTKPPNKEPTTTAATAPEEALQEAFEQFVSTMAQAAVSDAPLESLEQFVSSMARAEEVPLDEEEHGDYPQLLERHDEDDVDDDDDDDESSSSSESSASESSEFSSEEDEEEANAVVVSDGNETDAEVDAVLREALTTRDQTTETDDDEEVHEINLVEEVSSPYVVTDDHADKDEPSDPSVCPETPVSKSTSGDQHMMESYSPADDPTVTEEDDSNLPPLPPQPSEYPFRSFLGMSGSDDSDVDPTVGFFDPNDAAHFASLPAPHLLVHLLRYAVMTMEQRRLIPLPDTEQLITTVPGGMGAPLFPQKLPQKRGPDEKEKKDVLTLQLLVASLLVLNEKRDEAMENMRKAIAREQRCTVRADEGDSSHVDDASEVPLDSAGEEDDPAMALALNYVEDDVPLSSEALENKGMRRKAAAAAYDTEALLRTLRRQADEWKSSVTLYSYCVARALRLLRYLLQILVRRTFVSDGRAGDDIDNGMLPALKCHLYLPPNVSERLSTALSSLTMQVVQGEGIAGLEDEKEDERCLLRFTLYKEAISTWRECIPLFYPSPDLMVDLLKSQVASCSFTSRADMSPLSVDCLSVPPSSVEEIEYQKLQLLCRRFRVSDILDKFVPAPIPYLSQSDDDGDGGSGGRESGGETVVTDQRDPHWVGTLISMVENILQKHSKTGSELECLYFALCHRCHSRVLLLDGLYATTLTATEEASFSTFSSKAASTNDIVRISMNPSKTLVFDATKCADSIAMLSDSASGGGNGPSVHQRASKVWGTVLSTRHYSPKTGVHRWAVRLDKCERGHVFIGVATAQGSMRTYVGGDKYGWGMIGTQALWHDRRKIRGDYGATLRSGAIVIVTLDTDAGTISFGLWKDSSSASSLSVDPLVQSIVSAKKQGYSSGNIEDWGIAFEGLPLDSRLYPAVGLYQRDDRVTLLTVGENSGRVSGLDDTSSITAGQCFYPRNISSVDTDTIGLDTVVQVRSHNDHLSWDGIKYTAEVLENVTNFLDKPKGGSSLTMILPSLAASLCLLPASVPVLSARSAVVLMPHISRCITSLEAFFKRNKLGLSLFRTGIAEGKWTIRATGAGTNSSDFEEYVVDLKKKVDELSHTITIEGAGVGTVGKSKHGIVSIAGNILGSSLTFAEEWSEGNQEGVARSKDDASSCVVAARISLDGRRFEGTYRNVQYGTTGQIMGILSGAANDCMSKDMEPEQSMEVLRVCQFLLCMAHSHLASILGAAADFNIPDETDTKAKCGKDERRRASLASVLGMSVFSTAFAGLDNEPIQSLVDSVKSRFSPPVSRDMICGLQYDHLFVSSGLLDIDTTDVDPWGGFSRNQLEKFVADADEKFARQTGGTGSLAGLCPDAHAAARRQFILVLLYLSGLYTELVRSSPFETIETELLDSFKSIWRTALRVVDDGVRIAISRHSSKTKRDQALDLCNRFLSTSDFFLGITKRPARILSGKVLDEFLEGVAAAYEAIEDESDIAYLKAEMVLSSKRAILRSLSLREISNLLSTFRYGSPVSLESVSLTLPHQLGRGLVPFRSMSHERKRGMISDLDGTYLSGLFGANPRLKHSLTGQVVDLFKKFGCIMKDTIAELKKDGVFSYRSDHHSLILTILPLFSIQMRGDDFLEVILKSGILIFLPDVISIYRKGFLGGSSREDQEISSIIQRDLCLSVLRCCTSVAHSLIYQATVRSTTMNMVSDCLTFLMNELTLMLPLAERDAHLGLGQLVRQNLDEDIKRLGDIQEGKGSSKKASHSTSRIRSTNLSGIEYLRLFGASPKPLPRRLLSAQWATRPSFLSANFRTVALHELLSQLLHILCVVLRTPDSLQIFASNGRWLVTLFKVIGLNSKNEVDGGISSSSLRSHAEGILPAKFRSRIVRFLFPLLCATKPDPDAVEGLFELAGVTSSVVTKSLDEEETLISVECISLLRRLHSPSYGPWRDCVNRTIKAITSPDPTEKNFNKKVGVLSFFGGNTRSICQGSYVVLKPKNASALTPEQASASSPKSHSSAIGGSSGSAALGSAPHHVVGNGTDSVIAGLCSHTASAGIVSSIDTKNGFCEVILLPRRQESDHYGDNLSSDERVKAGNAIGHKQSLTIRALRTPLSDTFLSQEVPLHLDETVPAAPILGQILEESLSSLLSAVSPGSGRKEKDADIAVEANSRSDQNLSTEQKEELATEEMQDENVEKDEQERQAEEMSHKEPEVKSINKYTRNDGQGVMSGVVGLTCDLLVIRCCIVALSNQQILQSFMNRETNPAVTTLLSLAWPEPDETASSFDLIRDAREKSLSALALHESRLDHLLGLMRAIACRLQILKNTSDVDFNSMLEDCRPQQSSRADSVTDETKSEHQSEDAASSQTAHATNRSRREGTDAGRDSRSSTYRRSISQSTGGSNSDDDDDDDDDENQATSAAATHLREAAIAQMAELGLPRSWSELALRRVGGLNIEAAVSFCLECGGEMERLLAEERERERIMQGGSGGSSSRRAHQSSIPSNHLLRQLLEMGFPRRWCIEALAVTGNNVDEALTWILNNGERLSEEDEAIGAEEGDIDDGDEESADDEEDDDVDAGSGEAQNTNDLKTDADTAEPKNSWTGSVIPLRFISGRSIIDPKNLEISGLPNGGFSSVGTKGVMLTTGKWYYEAILETAGCLQIGWADGSFAGHCHADRGDGCGDGPSSWAYDGWRRYRWHSTATEWGCRWKEGDIVGCLVDMDERTVSFTLNGEGDSIGMGLAFSGEGFRPCGGVYACVSFNRKEKLRLILGGEGSEPFKHEPPEGYRGVGEAVLRAVTERDAIVRKEEILGFPLLGAKDEPRPFLCDFSDGEHGHELMAWGHRYYGSDASVHLGSGGPKQSTGTPRGGASGEQHVSFRDFVSRRLEKALSTYKESSETLHPSTRKSLNDGYEEVEKMVAFEIFSESLVVAILLSRKLILHSIVGMGSDFDPQCFGNEISTMRSLWRVLDVCASLRSAGWAGEAGAMAIAAEALGLGISSNELQQKTSDESSGIVAAFDLDNGLMLPVPGGSRLLDTVMLPETGIRLQDPVSITLTGAEVALCSGGGGSVTSFIREGLQSAINRSSDFRNILVAAVRRAVRLLAAVEYDGDDAKGVSEDVDDIESQYRKSDEKARQRIDAFFDQPDARLTGFLSGLLLSKTTASSVDGFEDLQDDLGESWSLGLLSASIPWRMICAYTVSGIINSRPYVLKKIVKSSAAVARFYGQLPSSSARRAWAERAAIPVCSRYAQAMVELLVSVKRAMKGLKDLPDDFASYWHRFQVDAATPLPLDSSLDRQPVRSLADWETEEGWASGDSGWIVWTGQVEYERVKWKAPPRSSVPSLMDGGDGPPMLDVGCTVLRGVDWGEEGSGRKSPDEDGKNLYDAEKSKRDKQKKSKKAEKIEEKESSPESDRHEVLEVPDTPGNADLFANPAETSEGGAGVQEKKYEEKAESEVEEKKLPSPKLPVGTVLGIEPWNGQPGLARKVRWHLTGEEGVYRFGGDGGRFDIVHVETNKKETRIRKRHPLPETAEQCASRHGFGKRKNFPVILRLKSTPFFQEKIIEGILEWPDFGAGIRVSCRGKEDGSVMIKEDQLLFGSRDSGWEIRFGQPTYVSGTEFVLSPSGSKFEEGVTPSSFSSLYEELSGSNTFEVRALRNPLNGKSLKVSSKMRLWHARNGPMPPPFSFDSEYHAPSLSLSLDGRTVSCTTSDGKGCAFASVGFTKGVHYWEVKLEQADIGSVFIGVAEKPNGSGSGASFGFDTTPRLNRWHGWGFVNFRATYTSGAERVYGAHCHAGDTVGVLLDCDAGRVSFFFDGLKYGEHILNDLGCAFENLSPFGFNVDGCGSGGAGQGAPNGFDGSRSGRYPSQGAVRPRALFPVVGLRSQGDRVTISSKWNTSYGVDGVTTVRSIIAVDDILSLYSNSLSKKQELNLPDWFVSESYSEYQTWSKASSIRTNSRGSGPCKLASFGLDLKLDSSPKACAAASASLGLDEALLSGDRVRLLRSAGRILELAEEALILGAFNGRLYYRIVSQKSEGGSLTEGGGRSWCFDESEVVDKLPFVRPGRAAGVPLPKLNRFKCPSSGGLKVVHEGGAVLRSDIEIFDGSMILGTIPAKSVLEKDSVLERRVNSCGVVRYRVRYEDLGEGWISARIRGGKEEPIVESVIAESDNSSTDITPEAYLTPEECADAWYKKWGKANQDESNFDIPTLGDFKKVLGEAIIPGLATVESDALVVSVVSCISNYTEGGDALECPFDIVASALSFALSSPMYKELSDRIPACREAAAAVLSRFVFKPSSLQAVLARIALLRALNRRMRLVLPWLSIRPCQEGSAILGGLNGYGTSVERAGRSKLSQLRNTWVHVPGIGSMIRQLRGLFFTSVKREFLLSVTEATTTPTPLSHDEYELPREIRTVRVNRLKAGRAMLSEDSSAKRKYSVFAQLQTETKSWGGAALRRGFIAKGHGGQRRAFRVKLIGEGVNDYSGPYREIFTDAVSEATKTDADGRGSLGVLDPTPNNASGIGEDRELFMFSLNGRDMNPTQAIPSKDLPEAMARIRQSFGFLTLPRDEASREVEESLVFLGRIVGTAFRHRISVDLPLPLHLVWKALAEEPLSAREQLAELDYLAHRQLEYADDSTLLLWQQRMLNAFTEGLGNVLPVELLPLMTGEELRETVCGNPEVDVDLLRRVVEYEGYEETEDKVVEYFWDTLREMTNDERKQFLQFVWARNRLPSRESDFEAPFKIQKDTLNEGKKADEALPSASTCFFSLTLPNYSSQDILREKLLFAITNVTTMETDFQTNSAEIAEGYRTF